MSMCLSHNGQAGLPWTFLPGAPARSCLPGSQLSPGRVPRWVRLPRLSPALPRLPQSASFFWEGPMAALSCRLQWRVQEGTRLGVCPCRP